MSDLFTVVVAAGRGKRVGAKMNKAFIKIGELPMLVHTLKSLASCCDCRDVAVVVGKDELSYTENLLSEYGEHFSCLNCQLVTGGKERQDSVTNALKIIPEGYSFVAIHDGARPFISKDIFARTYRAAIAKGAAIAVIPVNDTVKIIRNELVERTADRSKVVLVQTPQIFSLPILVNAYEKAAQEGFRGTDDASLVENYGCRVAVVEGSKENFKITTPEDVVWANIKCGAEKMDFRVGTGFDVHAFTDGDAIIIGGVSIPYEKRLLGHSDADVLLHAISDALLGAAGLGDIGKFFPDTDQKYKGADSKKLLSEVVAMLEQKGWSINNIDATIMAQKPKMAPYTENMQKIIADICHLSSDAVGVKATTTEKLGFVGREEGIAAQAVASIKANW